MVMAGSKGMRGVEGKNERVGGKEVSAKIHTSSYLLKKKCPRERELKAANSSSLTDKAVEEGKNASIQLTRPLLPRHNLTPATLGYG